MGSLGTIWAEIGVRWDKLDQGLRQAEARIRTANSRLDSLRKTGKRLRSAGTKMTKAITTPLLAAGGAAVKFAMDAVESENLFEVSMGRMADTARSWSNDLARALGLNAYNVRQNVGTFNVMFESMKLNEDAAYSMATGLTELAYDMSSFYNLPHEEAFQKLQSGITGEIEPLRRLGIMVDQNTVKTYAYTHGIAEQGEELTEQQKVLARYGVIMEQTGKAQGDMARTLDDPANKLRALKNRAVEAATDLGMKLIPTFEKLLDMGHRVIDWYNRLDDAQKQWIIRIGAVAAAIGPLLLVLGSLVGAIVAVGNAAAFLGIATGTMFGIIAAIGLLIAAGIYLWQNWEQVKQKAKQIWDSIYIYLRSFGEKTGIVLQRFAAIAKLMFAAIAESILTMLSKLPLIGKQFEGARDTVAKWAEDARAQLRRLEERWDQSTDRLALGLARVNTSVEGMRNAARETARRTSELADATDQAGEAAQGAGAGARQGAEGIDTLGNIAEAAKDKVVELTDRLRDLADQARETYQGALEKALNLVARGTISYDEAREYAGGVVSERYGAEGLKAAYLALKQRYYEAPKSFIDKMFRSTYGADPPRLASGGIVTRPTYALVGEAGPEAVIPLSRGTTLSGPVQIRVEMDGRILAERLLPHIHRAITIRIP